MASVYVQQAFDELDERGWNACLDVDLRASFLCSRAAVPHMRKQNGGRIVNFSDWLAKSGRPRYQGYLPYYVAKAGVMALTEALALELAPDNILVNAVAPGPILPPPNLSDDEVRAVEKSTPLGRWGGEMEIAKAVLASARVRLHHRRDRPGRWREDTSGDGRLSAGGRLSRILGLPARLSA